jgi:ABC-type amino acid transport system permease subunit
MTVTATQARQVLLANAVLDFLAGLLLLAGTWDGLWDALDLPQGKPATFVQVGGAALVGWAYLLWRAADAPPLRASVALAAAIVDGLAALVVLIWLVAGELPDYVDTLGTILLIALVLVLGVFAALKAGIARERPEPEEFKHRD